MCRSRTWSSSSFGLWVAYGLSLPNWALIVPNTVAFSVGLATILIAIRLRGPQAG
jgi:hypothetical protein